MPLQENDVFIKGPLYMKPFSGLQQKIQNWILRRQLNSGKIAEPANFNGASSVLILYNASNSELRKQLFQYVEKLRKHCSSVNLLGYKNSRLSKNQKAENGVFYLNHTGRFFNIPGNEVINLLNGLQYDYLIILSEEDLFPLNYLAVKCKAKFKAGNYTAIKAHFLDFMLSYTPEENPAVIIDQLDHYLNLIQKK